MLYKIIQIIYKIFWILKDIIFIGYCLMSYVIMSDVNTEN